jgi:hypothetical protein
MIILPRKARLLHVGTAGRKWRNKMGDDGLLAFLCGALIGGVVVWGILYVKVAWLVKRRLDDEKRGAAEYTKANKAFIDELKKAMQ